MCATLLGRRTPEEREALVKQGRRVDRLLRARVQAVRAVGMGSDGNAGGGAVCDLCRWPDAGRRTLTENEVVAHAGMLFMFSTEPVALPAAWCRSP